MFLFGHFLDWTALSTISTLPGIWSFPFSNIVSFSDGPVENSSGIPYMYLTPLDMSVQDLLVRLKSNILSLQSFVYLI